MCSFLFIQSRHEISDAQLHEANRYAKNRGPDSTNVVRQVSRRGKHLTFLHNLLDISGTTRLQPVEDGDHIALFNGEIYNFRSLGDYACDTDSIVPAFRTFGHRISSKLDGEFSGLVYSSLDESLCIFTDPFLTKPLFIGIDASSEKVGVATCESALRSLGFEGIRVATPNSSTSIDLSSGHTRIMERAPSFDFVPRQFKDSYDDWISAFLDSVRKRSAHGAHVPMVFLSSGYDSGAICLALNLLGIQYDTFTIEAGEDPVVLKERFRLNAEGACRNATKVRGLGVNELGKMQADINDNVERFEYTHEDADGVRTELHKDGGALGVNFLGRLARQRGNLVNLSGSGADEIISDYGFNGEKIYYHSEFGGKFPEDLGDIFPWKKFYGDTQRSYLFKDEYVLGRHGIEGRYPFLDRELVQEFLYLKASLKNAQYKAPLAHFLQAHGYPYEQQRKRGFSPCRSPTALERSIAQALRLPRFAFRRIHRLVNFLKR